MLWINWLFFHSTGRNPGFEHISVIIYNIFAYLPFSLSTNHINMVKKWCRFSQINVFHEYFPHSINILFLSSQCYLVHIHRQEKQMNSVNDSGEFQEVESNHSGRLSYVPSQPAAIPSSRSMSSCDKRLPLDTWEMSGPQENVFGNAFSAVDSSPTSLSQSSSFYDTRCYRIGSSAYWFRNSCRKRWRSK